MPPTTKPCPIHDEDGSLSRDHLINRDVVVYKHGMSKERDTFALYLFKYSANLRITPDYDKTFLSQEDDS